jgi:glycosyltransferase involved in cell wall biosynthesis
VGLRGGPAARRCALRAAARSRPYVRGVTDATILIPTFDRPERLRRAVDSALAQTHRDSEVVVIDDGSPTPVRLPSDPRLRVLVLDRNRGHCAARNVGLSNARGRYVTCLDDDDTLTPQHLEVALEALSAADLPGPVAAITGLETVGEDGAVAERRLPPTLPRGRLYSLEEPPPGTSFAVRNTLVVERDLLLGLGGWDEALASRVHTELFLRLNPVCSLLGVPVVTYRRHRHDGPQVSSDPHRRIVSQRQIEAKHAAAFAARRPRAADMIFRQAFKLWTAGARGPAVTTWARAVRTHPPRAGRLTGAALRDRWRHARGG